MRGPFSSTLFSTQSIILISICYLTSASTYAQTDDKKDSSLLEEVTVTAERVEKSALDTAMTVSAFSSDMLEKFNMQDRDKLQLLVPGLQFGETSDQEGNGTSLRGIGTRNAGIDHGDRSVATYVDGAYTIGVYGTSPGGGFDLERVEVARGPQGTLNGRNSVAGSINYIYKKPTQEWDFDVMGQANNFSQQRLNVALGGPLNDYVSFRATGGMYTGDGYQENFGPAPDMDAPDHEFGAIQFRIQGEKFDSNIRVARVTDSGIPRSRVPLSNVNRTDPTIATLDAANPRPLFGNEPTDLVVQGVNVNYLSAIPNPSGPSDCPSYTPYFQCGDIENKVAHNRGGYEDSEADMLNLYVQYEFADNMSLRYTYADNDVQTFVYRDADYTPRVSGTTHMLASDGNVEFLDRAYSLDYQYEEESHELLFKWSPSDQLNIIAGAFMYESDISFDLVRFEYSHSWRFTDSDTEAAALGSIFGATFTDCQGYVDGVWRDAFGLATEPSGTDTFVFCPGTYDLPGQTTSDLTGRTVFGTAQQNETEAVFVNVDYQINDSWSVSGGLRWLDDTKTQDALSGFSMSTSFLTIPIVFGFFDGAVATTESWDAVVGSLTLEYRTAAENMVYGRISTGHKPGAFNFASPPVPDLPTSVKESELTNYEIGVKGTYLDGKLQLSTSAFLMQYDAMHLGAVLPLPPNLQPDPFGESPLAEYTAAIDDTDVWGLEVQYAYAFTENTSIMGFYAYTDSEIGQHADQVDGDPDAIWGFWERGDPEDPTSTLSTIYQLPNDQTGNQLPSSPEHKFAATLIHNMGLSNGSSLDFIATWAYNGSMYPSIANIERFKVPSYNRVDMSVTFTPEASNWSAMLYVNNVFDEIGLNEFRAASGFGSQTYLGSPTNHREVGVIVRWSPQF